MLTALIVVSILFLICAAILAYTYLNRRYQFRQFKNFVDDQVGKSKRYRKARLKGFFSSLNEDLTAKEKEDKADAIWGPENILITKIIEAVQDQRIHHAKAILQQLNEISNSYQDIAADLLVGGEEEEEIVEVEETEPDEEKKTTDEGGLVIKNKVVRQTQSADAKMRRFKRAQKQLQERYDMAMQTLNSLFLEYTALFDIATNKKKEHTVEEINKILLESTEILSPPKAEKEEKSAAKKLDSSLASELQNEILRDNPAFQAELKESVDLLNSLFQEYMAMFGINDYLEQTLTVSEIKDVIESLVTLSSKDNKSESKMNKKDPLTRAEENELKTQELLQLAQGTNHQLQTELNQAVDLLNLLYQELMRSFGMDADDVHLNSIDEIKNRLNSSIGLQRTSQKSLKELHDIRRESRDEVAQIEAQLKLVEAENAATKEQLDYTVALLNGLYAEHMQQHDVALADSNALSMEEMSQRLKGVVPEEVLNPFLNAHSIKNKEPSEENIDSQRIVKALQKDNQKLKAEHDDTSQLLNEIFSEYASMYGIDKGTSKTLTAKEIRNLLNPS